MATINKPVVDLKTPKVEIVQVTPLAGAPSVSFRSLDSFSSQFFDDDYVHGKFLTAKYKGVGTNFLVNAKASWKLDIKKDAKPKEASKEGEKTPVVEVPVTTGEAKLITRLSDKIVLESRFDQAGTVRFWANFGRYDLGRPVNVFAKVKTNSAIDWVSGWVGGALAGENYNYNTRLDKKRSGEFLINEKLHLFKDKFSFFTDAKLSLSNFTLRRYNALLAYREKKFDVVAQHVSRSPPQEKLSVGELSLAVYYRHNKHQAAVKGSFNHWETDVDKRVTVALAGISSLDAKNTAKAKIDLNGNFAVSLKHKWDKNVTATISTGINLKKPESYVKESKIPVPVGFQFEFAY
jgi:hypothetical protein